MASKPAITIPKTTKVKIISNANKNLTKKGAKISPQDLLRYSNQVDMISEIIVSEMLGSKNKYLIDLRKELGDNK